MLSVQSMALVNELQHFSPVAELRTDSVLLRAYTTVNQ